MNKTEFKKQAMAKYKEAVDKKWVAEMNFIYSDKLILRVWYDVELHKQFVGRDSEIKGETAFSHRWCTVETLPIDNQKQIEKELGRYTANDGEDYPRMINSLRKALKENPDGMVDDVDGVDMWEKVEMEFTTKAFCELIGLK